MRVALLLLLTAWLAGCDEGTSRIGGVTCASNYECTVGSTFGTCQENGYCAYPDATCAGGTRYSPGAPDVGGQCVSGTCGGGGEACCASDTCAAGFGCVGGMCTCGDVEGAPCCGGTTCGTNLACDSGNCVCGGPGEPCCGGDTCNSGTCNAGTCSSTWTKIALGRHFVCGVRPDGRVACWGNDKFQYGRQNPGQLTPALDSLTPRVIAGAINVAAIDAGEGHACIRKLDNTLWCWGQGTRGQLGNGMSQSSKDAVQVPGLTNVSQFSAGRQHTCAIGSFNGTAGLYCWGKNGVRNRIGETDILNIQGSRLGNGAFDNTATPTAVDMSQMAASGQTPKLVAAGGYHTCAVMSDERVWCWGYNGARGLGDNTMSHRFTPVLVDFSQITIPTGVTIAEIEIGTGYADRNGTFIRLSNGTVYSWGGTGAQGGNGSTSTTPRPVTPVSGNHVFTKLAPLVYSMCALDNAGKVWCWGDGQAGQLGTGGTTDQTTPVEVPLTAAATALSGGHRTACVLYAAGTLTCWGNNRKGVITRSVPSVDDLVIELPREVP